MKDWRLINFFVGLFPGADTAIYLATLPSDMTSCPKGEFLAERVVLDWRQLSGWRLALHGFGYVFRTIRNSIMSYLWLNTFVLDLYL